MIYPLHAAIKTEVAPKQCNAGLIITGACARVGGQLKQGLDVIITLAINTTIVAIKIIIIIIVVINIILSITLSKIVAIIFITPIFILGGFHLDLGILY